MEILIIGDKHGDKFYNFEELEKHLSLNGIIVDLGDHFDAFKRTTEEQLVIFRELVSLKEQYPKQVILLLGNHDIQYFTMFNLQKKGEERKFCLRSCYYSPVASYSISLLSVAISLHVNSPRQRLLMDV